MKIPDINNCKEIAAGGEGRIIEHPSNKSQVIKVYHIPRDLKYSKHLEYLNKLPSHIFIKPIDIYTDNNKTIGFSMNYVNFNNYWLFNNLFNKGFCTTNKITEDFKIIVLKNLKKNLEILHNDNINVGDLNQYNLFVSKQGDIIFIDVDSYQTKENNHSGVLLDEIRDWNTTLINDKTDIWAYNILAFWSTSFVHPFKWVAPGNKESLEQRVKQGKSILTSIKDIKIPALYNPPTGEILKQFKEVLHTARRYFVEFDGVHIPINLQIPQQLTSADVTIKELFKNVYEVFCDLEKITFRTNKNWECIKTNIKSTYTNNPLLSAIPKISENVDFLYPSNNNICVIKNNGILGSEQKFIQPEYYYHKGNLMVVDYATDTQYNYNIDVQFAGIAYSQTQVFAKSIQFKTTPIQNFGALKYLNIPKGISYELIKLPKGTIDAFYCDGYYIIERKHNQSIVYELYQNENLLIDGLDCLSHFCYSNSLLFIPDDGKIIIYSSIGGKQIMNLNLPICTKTSKLWYTTSGIILLENNILYLINTK